MFKRVPEEEEEEEGKRKKEREEKRRRGEGKEKRRNKKRKRGENKKEAAPQRVDPPSDADSSFALTDQGWLNSATDFCARSPR